jgi:hypothetical protein
MTNAEGMIDCNDEVTASVNFAIRLREQGSPRIDNEFIFFLSLPLYALDRWTNIW